MHALPPLSDTLYCPNCRYNLTGLSENLCPECGERFDPKWLGFQVYYPPASPGWVAMRLLFPPLLLVMSSVITRAEFCLGAPMLLGSGMFVLIYGMVNAFEIATRISYSRAWKTQTPPWDRRNHRVAMLSAIGLWLVQVALGIFGCMMVSR